MRKILSLLFILYLLCGTPIIFVSADDDFAIVDGQSFVYDVITSIIDITVNRNDLSVDTFQFGGYQFSSNKSIEVSVTYVHWNKVNYSITCDNITYNTTYSDSESSRTNYYFRFIGEVISISFSFQDALSEYGYLLPSPLSNGIPLWILFFIPPEESTWDHLREISDQLNIDPYLEYTPTSSLFSNLILNSSYQEENDLATLENYIQASIDDIVIEGIINNGFKIVYNMTNGVLYGLRYLYYFDGKYYGDKVHCEVEFHIEIAGYNLTELFFYSDVQDQLDYKIYAYIFIGIFTIGVIIPFVIIAIRKRRRL